MKIPRRSYTWRNVERDTASEIRSSLLERGWKEDQIKSYKEEWRIKTEGINIIFYRNGTFFISYSDRSVLEFVNVWRLIRDRLGSRYLLPEKEVLIGLDETGKGEVIGSIILAGVIFPSEIFFDLDLDIDNVDTKSSHSFDYWDRIGKEIMNFRPRGFNFIVNKILPLEIESNNVNRIMDSRYKKILSEILQDVPLDRCRIVIDDYGVDGELMPFLENIREKGASVFITSGSENIFLETRIASIIAKWERMKELKDIGISFGSGNLNDRSTINWLEEWYKVHRDWPWFVKRSFQTIKRIEKSFYNGGR
jgi:ribonuclease HII